MRRPAPDGVNLSAGASAYDPSPGIARPRRKPQEIRVDDDELTRCFREIGGGYGFEEVVADFAPFRDFKIRWSRSHRWAAFEVSDYLSDAPEDVVRALATTIFRRIRGEGGGYPREVVGWLTRDGFVESKQPVFVRRYVGLTTGTRGESKDLADSLARLLDAGLVADDPEVYVGWVKPGSGRSAGSSSVLMKVVAVNGLLDDDGVCDALVDYCLYAQLTHIGMGFSPGDGRRAAEFDRLLSEYPGRDRMESMLRQMRLRLRMGVSPGR